MLLKISLKTVLRALLRVLLTVFLFCLLLTAIAMGSGYWLYEAQLKAPLPLTEEWHYTLSPNATLSTVAKDLITQGLLNYPNALLWVFLARTQNKAQRIKAGDYAVPVGTSPQTFLEILISGKTIRYTLTLPEGWNFHQVMAAIHQHPHLTHTLTNLDDAAIMAKLGWSDQQPEGRFYPDTYSFPKGMTDVAFLQRAYHAMVKELDEIWQKRNKDLPLKTPHEALILASLVEKETAVSDERPLIAGVFIRRLQKNMKLQTDPTVIYALGSAYNGNIRKQDLETKNPYNTYVNFGLPPTPIAMPGRAALQAAVNPANGDALYFVAKGNGSHYFSPSYPEHECAVIEYQLKKPIPKRCYRYPKLKEEKRK
jgi:UPF0755 protein